MAEQTALTLTWEEERGAAAARVSNARLICPTPYKTSFGSLDKAAAVAARMTARRGTEFAAGECVCRRFHVSLAHPVSAVS